jgi:hypothetical protein
MNPFLKRATEHLSDPEAFLGLVSPEPAGVYLRPVAEQDALYDRLIMILGTPGSGKTTIARLFTLPVVCALLRHRDAQEHRATLTMLSGCRVTDGVLPTVLGYRVPLEAEYRDLWELPYEDNVKVGLTMALIQARTVLGWLRALANVGADVGTTELQFAQPDSAAVTAIGGPTQTGAKQKAQEVENAVYKTATALVAPALDEIDSATLGAYRPFDVLTKMTCSWDGVNTCALKPLVILDDAHALHPVQFNACKRWLMRRELSVARWLMTRLDALSPADALAPQISALASEQHGVTPRRDFLTIHMQVQSGQPAEGGRNRRKARGDFRRMAQDMGDRYLKTMPVFSRRNRTSLSNLLNMNADFSSESDSTKIEEQVRAFAKRAGIPDSKVEEMRMSVDGYATTDQPDRAVRAQMLLILLNRYIKRRPQGDLFESQVEESRMPTANSGIRASAEIQLLHKVKRPFYFGPKMLFDASGENIEQFLRLAGCLVEVAELNIIRRREIVSLSATIQNKLLRQRATEMLSGWQFPMHSQVRVLVDAMATKCLAKTLEGNAPLDGGANAFGIPQDDYATMFSAHPQFARVVQFAVAHNAISLVPHYQQGGNNREWCLLEICGPAALVHGLTLKRGGFIESSIEQILELVEGHRS